MVVPGSLSSRNSVNPDEMELDEVSYSCFFPISIITRVIGNLGIPGNFINVMSRPVNLLKIEIYSCDAKAKFVAAIIPASFHFKFID